MLLSQCSSAILLLLAIPQAAALDNGVGMTPGLNPAHTDPSLSCTHYSSRDLSSSIAVRLVVYTTDHVHDSGYGSHGVQYME